MASIYDSTRSDKIWCKCEYKHKYYGHLSYKILQTESKFCWHQQFLSHGCMGAELLLQDFKTSFEFKTMSHSTEIGTLFIRLAV